MSTLPEWPVCRLEDLPDPGAREFVTGRGEWPFPGFVVRLDDRLFAYANICPHRHHPLNLADDDFLVPGARLLRCASHGALFSAETGLCLVGPCAGRSLRRLDCRVESGQILVRAPASLQQEGQGIT